MRIIAGSRKGMRLAVPRGRAVRPTSDRAREGLMSMLGGRFDGERVLDLFAGTGAVGLELLSRGCGRAVFVERAPEALGCLQDNIERVRMTDRAAVRHQDARQAIDDLDRAGERFDIVFVDPPYGRGLVAPTLRALADSGLLCAGAAVWVETETGLDPALVPAPLAHLRARRYGRIAFDELGMPADDDLAAARAPEEQP